MAQKARSNFSDAATWPQRTKIISSKQRMWSSRLKMHVHVSREAGFWDSVPATSAFGSEAVGTKVATWFGSRECYRHFRRWVGVCGESRAHCLPSVQREKKLPKQTRESLNWGSYGVMETRQVCAFEGDSKITPHVFTGGRWKFNYFIGTLRSQHFRSQQEVARVWQQDSGLGTWSSRFKSVCGLSAGSHRQMCQSQFVFSFQKVCLWGYLFCIPYRLWLPWKNI